MNENVNLLQKKKKSMGRRNEQQGQLKIRNRTDYKKELFGDYTAADVKFSQWIPFKVQISKLKEIFKLNDIEDGTVGNYLSSADSLYIDDLLKTEIYSSGIKGFDAIFSAKGISSGEILEFSGLPQTGKTLLIHTILVNIVKDNRSIEAIYFDSQANFQIHRLVDIFKAHGLQPKEITDITDRLGFVQINNMFDLLHALQELFDPHRMCHIYKKNFDITKIRIIVINSITLPFYHISSPVSVSKKITSDLHKLIHRLAKEYGIVFFITNLALHKYKISESDKGDDVSSIGSVKSTKEEIVQLEDVKAALDEYWPEILDHRFVITAINSKCDILGYMEIPRQITLVESRTEKSGKSITVRITDMGMI